MAGYRRWTVRRVGVPAAVVLILCSLLYGCPGSTIGPDPNSGDPNTSQPSGSDPNDADPNASSQLPPDPNDGDPNSGTQTDPNDSSSTPPTPELPDVLWEVPGYRTTYGFRSTALASVPSTDLFALPTFYGVRLWHLSNGRPGLHLVGSTANPDCIAFAPDGTTIAAAGPDGLLSLWRVADGVVLWSQAHEHQGTVDAIAFSEDGQTLATVGDGAVHLRRVLDGELLRTLSSADGGQVVAFAPNSQSLAWASEQNVKIWSVATGTLQQTLSTSAIALRFAADGQTLAVVTREPASLKTWDLTSGQVQSTTLLEGNPAMLSGVAVFSPDEAVLSAVSGPVFTWRASDGTLISKVQGGRFDAPGGFLNLAYASNGQKLITYGNFGVYFWRTADGQSLGRLPAHYSPIGAVAFGPDGQTLYSGGGGEGPDFNSSLPTLEYFDTPREWRAADGAPLRVFDRKGEVGSLLLSPDGQYLVVGGTGCTCGAHVVHLTDGQVVARVAGARMVGLGFAPDGSWLMAASQGVATKCCQGKPSLSIWAFPEVTNLYDLVAGYPPYSATAAVLAPDGEVVASQEDALLLLRRISDGAVIWSRSTDEDPVGFNAGGDMLIAKDDDSFVYRHVADGDHIRTVIGDSPIGGTVLSADRSLLASCHADGTIKLWSTADGTLLRIYTDTAARCVAFSPDADRIAWGRGDGSIAVARIPYGSGGQ